MFHWMLVAPQALTSVLPVEDSFSNNEMHTFSRIRAHQSTSETCNKSLWRRKTKPTSVYYFAIVDLATNKTCGTLPWHVSAFSVLWNIMFYKWLFITISKRTCFIFQKIFPQFSGILADQRVQRPISFPQVIASASGDSEGGHGWAMAPPIFAWPTVWTPSFIHNFPFKMVWLT